MPNPMQPQQQQAPQEAPQQPQGADQQVPTQPQVQQPQVSPLDALPEDQKAMVAEHLTPELAQIVGMITGDAALAQQLELLADSTKVLVPLPREEFLALLQQEE